MVKNLLIKLDFRFVCLLKINIILIKLIQNEYDVFFLQNSGRIISYHCIFVK